MSNNATELEQELGKLKKISDEVKYLRRQHRDDMLRLKEYEDGLKQVMAASDALLASLLEEYGEPVVDDGQVIGRAICLPAPKLRDGVRVIGRPYDKYVGLDKTQMLRLGLLYTD